MSNQQPGTSQPRPRQQSGLSDMQLWQQQVVFKQLQELQRQKQLQHLEQDGRHQSPMNQQPTFGKHASNNQLPAIVNGMPIHGSANYAWQNELSGSHSKVPNSSQMFLGGNTNWAQRGGYSALQGIPDGPLSNEQSQMLRSMGLGPQQFDQSVYGAHNANTRGAFNQYSHLQGVPQDSANIANKANGNHLDKSILQSYPVMNSLQGGQCALFSNQVSMHDGTSVSRQGFQGNSIFGDIPLQNTSSGVQAGNCLQVNSPSSNALVQGFQDREQQAGWSGNLQEQAASHIGSSQGMVTLDPTEKKILFSSDDHIWDSHIGKDGTTGVGGYGNSLESVEHLNEFSSIQSGTWSALMQSAVAETSSSDTGFQDEWSGLSYHKKELSTIDKSLALGDSSQQTNWADSNLHTGSSLTSKPFPLFDDGKLSQSGQNPPQFQQSSTRNLYEQSERMRHDGPYESTQPSLNDSGKWLDRCPQPKTHIEGNQQVQPSMNSENTFPSAWTRQIQTESASHSANLALDTHNLQGSWVQQHGMSSHDTNSQHSNNIAGWNTNNLLLASGDATLRISDNENRGKGFQRNDLKMGMHLEKNHGSRSMTANAFPNSPDMEGSHPIKRENSFANNCTTPNSSTTKSIQGTNHQILNSHHPNNRKHMVSSPVNYRDDGMGYNQNLIGSQVLEARTYNSDRGSVETYDKKQEHCYQKEFSNDSYNSNQSQPTGTGGGLRENSWLSTSDSRPIANANESTAQAARKASVQRRFQYHPMGSMDVDLEATEVSKRVSHMQVPSKHVFNESKGHEREYVGYLGSNTSNKAISMEKEHIPDFHGTEKGSASSDGSAGTFPQSKRTVQTCQNMLDLFHNVDQSMEHGTPASFSSSDRDPSSVMPEAEGSDTSIRQWHSQSTASQGFGLRLAPPSERLPATNHVLNSQNSSQLGNTLNARQNGSKIEEKSKTWSASSVQSLPHEISQRERWDNTPNISGQTVNETSHLNMQTSFPAAFTSSPPYSRNQLQSQQMARNSDKIMNSPPVNVSNDRFASHFGQSQGIYGEVVEDQSVQVSLPGTTSRAASVVASPSEDTSQQEISSWSQVRVSGQQFPVLESVPISRPSAMSGRSQQGDFSSMLHRVWANASTQQHLTGGPPNKVPPNLSQSSPSNSNQERHPFTSQQIERGGNGPDSATGSTNSQHFAYGEAQTCKESSLKQLPTEKVDQTLQGSGASLGKESVAKHLLDTKSTASIQLVGHPHQQEGDKGRYGMNPALVSQKENASFRNPSTSTRDIEAFGHSLRQANQSYSLLHQMQTMKSMDSDLDKRSGKRYKGDGDVIVAQQLANRTGQQLLDGRNTVVRDSLNSSPNATVRHSSLTSGDGKMFSFSSVGSEDQTVNTASQMVRGVVPSQDLVPSNRNDSHYHYSQLSMSSMRPENPQINPKMAPTWFDRYGTFKPELNTPMQGAQNTARPIPQQFVFVTGTDGLQANSSKKQVDVVEASQIDNFGQSMVMPVVNSEKSTQLQPLPSKVTDRVLADVRPKKRKTVTTVCMPWHKEILCGSQMLQTTSMAEQDWAHAANRLVEKMEDEAELADDGQPLTRQRRRLVSTTQLMQQLFCPAPVDVLSAKVTSEYETVTYSVAKLALGEACGLVSSSGSDSHLPIVNESSEPGKLKTSVSVRGQYFSKVVENFNLGAKKLETDLLRLDKRVSVMDLRLEFQDLERFSFLNRFAKFHGRGQVDGAETSSSASNAAAAKAQKPQRYVIGHPMPKNLPTGVQCLSL